MHGRETVRSSNAATVLRTLVPQARAIFKLLAEHQMEERDEGEEEGVPSALTFDRVHARNRQSTQQDTSKCMAVSSD